MTPMTPEEMEASLKERPLTDAEFEALQADMAILILLERFDDAAFDRAMEATACLCVDRFVCTRCKIIDKLS